MVGSEASKRTTEGAGCRRQDRVNRIAVRVKKRIA
jgi:hypothetical protein